MQVGKANGLTVLLDAETFDYTYHLKVSITLRLHQSLKSKYKPLTTPIT